MEISRFVRLFEKQSYVITKHHLPLTKILWGLPIELKHKVFENLLNSSWLWDWNKSSHALEIDAWILRNCTDDTDIATFEFLAHQPWVKRVVVRTCHEFTLRNQWYNIRISHHVDGEEFDWMMQFIPPKKIVLDMKNY